VAGRCPDPRRLHRPGGRPGQPGDARRLCARRSRGGGASADESHQRPGRDAPRSCRHRLARDRATKPRAAEETVLVHGTGGVALFALQLAIALGARVAITSSSDTKLARVRALGAAETINYRAHKDLAERVLEWSGPDGVDHVIETIGGDNLNLSLQAVKVGGTVSFIGLIAGQTANVNTYEFVTKNVTIHGIETGSREMFEELAAFIDDHGVTPVIDSTFPVEEVVSALEYLRSGRHFGKIVLTP
jgi:NADPH:quinone reductase-like Zn-dependent oxidoreductase